MARINQRPEVLNAHLKSAYVKATLESIVKLECSTWLELVEKSGYVKGSVLRAVDYLKKMDLVYCPYERAYMATERGKIALAIMMGIDARKRHKRAEGLRQELRRQVKAEYAAKEYPL